MTNRIKLLKRLDEINEAIRKALSLLFQISDQGSRDKIIVWVQQSKKSRVDIEAELSARYLPAH